MQGTARLTGQTIGALTMTLVFTMTSMECAPRIGFGIAAGLTLIAGLVSTLGAPEAAWVSPQLVSLEHLGKRSQPLLAI